MELRCIFCYLSALCALFFTVIANADETCNDYSVYVYDAGDAEGIRRSQECERSVTSTIEQCQCFSKPYSSILLQLKSDSPVEVRTCEFKLEHPQSQVPCTSGLEICASYCRTASHQKLNYAGFSQ